MAKPYVVPTLDAEIAAYLVFVMRWTFGDVTEAAVLAGRDIRGFERLLKEHGVDPAKYGAEVKIAHRNLVIEAKPPKVRGARRRDDSVASQIRKLLGSASLEWTLAEIRDELKLPTEKIAPALSQMCSTRHVQRSGERGAYRYAIA